MTFLVRGKGLAWCFGPLCCRAAWAEPPSLPRCGWRLVMLYDSWFTLGSSGRKGTVSMWRSTGILTPVNPVLFLENQRAESCICPEIAAWKILESRCVCVTYQNTHLTTNLLTHVNFIFHSAAPIYFLFLPLFPPLACFENAGQHMLSQSLQKQQKKVQEAARETAE